MKKFFKVFCLVLQFIKCLGCAHRDKCEYSLFVEYKGVKYIVTAKSVEDTNKVGE